MRVRESSADKIVYHTSVLPILDLDNPPQQQLLQTPTGNKWMNFRISKVFSNMELESVFLAKYPSYPSYETSSVKMPRCQTSQYLKNTARSQDILEIARVIPKLQDTMGVDSHFFGFQQQSGSMFPNLVSWASLIYR